MILDFEKLSSEPRILMEAILKPLQGARFQATDFADIGPGQFTLADGSRMLLLESPPSMANRLEQTCWDRTTYDLIKSLNGLPYIKVLDSRGKFLTSSILEANRIDSHYIMQAQKTQAPKAVQARTKTQNSRNVGTKQANNGGSFSADFAREIEYLENSPVDWQKLYSALFKYDPNSLIHGCFLEAIGGRLRTPRLLSAFIEASDIGTVERGGLKLNAVEPGIKGGEGNVLYHRTEFVAKEIKAYFNLDLALLYGYNLDEDATRLLLALSLFKIKRFLSTGLRLRSACDLRVDGSLSITEPSNGLSIESNADEEALLKTCKQMIAKCLTKGLFAQPAITELQQSSSTSTNTNTARNKQSITNRKQLSNSNEDDE